MFILFRAMYFLYQFRKSVLDYYKIYDDYNILKLKNEKIIKENNDLLYKLEGVKLANKKIYKKYQLLILNNVL